MIPEVKALPAEAAVLRRLAHVTLTPLAVPELVGRVVRWPLHIVELLELALLLLLSDHAAQVALYLLHPHRIRLIADAVHRVPVQVHLHAEEDEDWRDLLADVNRDRDDEHGAHQRHHRA